MTFATAVPIYLLVLCIAQMYNWSVIHGIKRKPHLSVVWNWYHFVAIAILHQPRPTDSADINTRLQLSDTSSIPPMHDGFLLIYGIAPQMWLMDWSTVMINVVDVYLFFQQHRARQTHAETTLGWVIHLVCSSDKKHTFIMGSTYFKRA